MKDYFVVLLSFSNRCLSCSDKTRSTTWLHPRTGEPVNSGHMIRSGTRQSILILRDTEATFLFCSVFSVCGGSFNVGFFFRLIDLPRGWEEGFTDEGASYFIKWVWLWSIVALFDRAKFDPISWLFRFKAPCVKWFDFPSGHRAVLTRWSCGQTLQLKLDSTVWWKQHISSENTACKRHMTPKRTSMCIYILGSHRRGEITSACIVNGEWHCLAGQERRLLKFSSHPPCRTSTLSIR